MATTFYSTASSGFRCRCDYNVSSSNTTTTVSGTIYLQHNGAAKSMALGWVAGIGWGNYSTDDYVSVTTAEVTSVAKHTSWTNVKSTTFSFSFSNSHSASTIYLIIATGNALVNQGIVRRAVTIPAKPSYAVAYYSYDGKVWANDTKYYNETYRLLRITPVRSGYVFDRWNTQADGSGMDYAASSTYTTNEPLTLYAQWYAVPTISSLTVVRCDAQGQEDSDGHCALVTCVWSIASETATVTGKITPQGGTQTAFAFSEGSTGTSGTAIAIISADNGLEIDPDTQYVVEVTATNNAYSSATTSVNEILTRAYFVMDFKAGGLGVGIGRAAPTNGLEIGYETSFDENAKFYADVLISDKAHVMRALFDFVYPVGSYYETSDTTFDPNVTWGGTWELETEGQVHVSAGGGYLVNGANSNTSDGGTKDSVVVSHHHLVSSGWQTASGQSDKITYGTVSGRYQNSGYGGVQFIQDTGVSGTDKNMPPYIVVNRWHRTA